MRLYLSLLILLIYSISNLTKKKSPQTLPLLLWCFQTLGNLPHRSAILLVVITVQSLSHVQLFVTPWSSERQAPLCSTISQSLLKFTFIESVMPSNHLILCCPLLLLPSVFPSIRVFSSESAFSIKWLKFWSFSFSISPSSEYSVLLISFRID